MRDLGQLRQHSVGTNITANVYDFGGVESRKVLKRVSARIADHACSAAAIRPRHDVVERVMGVAMNPKLRAEFLNYPTQVRAKPRGQNVTLESNGNGTRVGGNE